MHTRDNLLFLFRRTVYILCLLGFSQSCQNIFIKPAETQPPKSQTPNQSSERGFDVVATSPDAASTSSNEDQPVTTSSQSETGSKPAPTSSLHQHALVVGIDRYQYADGRRFTNLAGAVNDAEVLRDALRSTGQVNLPDKWVLLNEQATRKGVIEAWQEMVKQAEPGDTLIFTYAGHGGQQPDTAPKDEKDGSDETLMLHDFNPGHASQGRIIDDELYGIFKEASDYKILFLADSCHSSGMVRAVAQTRGLARTGGFWEIVKDALPAILLPKQGDTAEPPPNVTLITGVNSDHLQVPETILDNKPHGALSWFFAKALSGIADGNQNGRLERRELENFLTEKVSVQMRQRQKPKLLPRGDTRAVFDLGRSVSPMPVQEISEIAIIIQNGTPPEGLKRARVVDDSQTVDLFFVVDGQQTEVFNNTGDKVTTLQNNTLESWQRLVDKKYLLNALETQFNMRYNPIRIALREGDKLHKRGDKLHFSIEPGPRIKGIDLI